MNRRSFLKHSGQGIAGAAVLGSLPLKAQADQTQTAQVKKARPTIYRTLGRTGIRLPIISMGVMNANNPDLVRAALDKGIVHLDTAGRYQRGQNETMIGEVVKGRPRDSFVLATKVYENQDRATGLFSPDAKSETFIETFHDSLKRLQLEYVDILYLHSIKNPEAATFEPYLSAMLKLKKEGKVRHLGVSTHQNEPAVIRYSTDCGHYDVLLTSYNFRQQHRDEVADAVAYAAGKGMGIVGMKAIAGVVRDIKGENKQVNAKAALKWAMQNENIHTNIAGFTTFEQLEEDLAVMGDINLTAEELQEIEATRALTGVYCQQCGTCLTQCRHKLDIPDLMRGYMYAHGYKNLHEAQATLDLIGNGQLECQACDSCQVRCPMGFDVKERALAVVKLKGLSHHFLS